MAEWHQEALCYHLRSSSQLGKNTHVRPDMKGCQSSFIVGYGLSFLFNMWFSVVTIYVPTLYSFYIIFWGNAQV